VAAGIVHNLRNPLTTIMGFGELLYQSHPELDGLEEIVDAAQRMKDMVEDILAKSRQRKDTEAVDFNLLLHRELDFMEADFIFKNKVEKEISLAEDLPPVECVYTDFSQTVGNRCATRSTRCTTASPKAWGPGRIRRRTRRPRDHRQRLRHPRGEHSPPLRPLLHHQGDRGHGRRAGGHRLGIVYDSAADGTLRG
jgi:signal transduction histidine kinase